MRQPRWWHGRRTESGASAVEYGLLVALIAAVVVASVLALGLTVHKSFSGSCEELKKPGLMTAASTDCTDG